LALAKRLDLRVKQGQVYDAQRAVVVTADALGAELTLLGTAALSDERPVSSKELDKLRLRPKRGVYSAVATLDLPFERTAEAVNYRSSLIALEQAVRAVQEQEDAIKLEIRGELRDIVEARENLYIQAKAVELAGKRVKSVGLFLEAGRTGIQIRDLLEAQDALLSAQNQLTQAIVSYRMSELKLQRDMEVLEVNGEGLWREYQPEKVDAQN
jgi:outer membrane protein TolC